MNGAGSDRQCSQISVPSRGAVSMGSGAGIFHRDRNGSWFVGRLGGLGAVRVLRRGGLLAKDRPSGLRGNHSMCRPLGVMVSRDGGAQPALQQVLVTVNSSGLMAVAPRHPDRYDVGCASLRAPSRTQAPGPFWLS